MKINEFNNLPQEAVYTELEKCCGSKKWVKAMIQSRPFIDVLSLHNTANKIWKNVSTSDILEAFTHHPQIGDIDSLKKKFASTSTWAGNEQQGTSQACDKVLLALKQGNEDYLKKFGFIFIVCATGKSAQEMLDLLLERMHNDKAIELHIAAEEQNKITHLRIDKLLED